MERYEIQARLGALRAVMEKEGMDFCLIPTADFHGSEYVGGYFKAREYFSGFTGSAGTLLVWRDGAGLWTDGRYFVQAQRELEGTGITVSLGRRRSAGYSRFSGRTYGRETDAGI